MKKIKVAFFAEMLIEDFDGAVRTMFQLIRRINKARFDFLFIYGTGPDQIDDFESLKIPSVSLPINANYTMALPVLSQTKLNDKLEAFSPDIVHIATPSFLGSFGLNYAKERGVPVISIYHTHFISYLNYYLKHVPFLINKAKQILADSHKNFYNQCDMVYIPSKSIQQELCEWGVKPSVMKLWQRGIDNKLFSPEKKDARKMKKLTGNNKPTIMFASRLVWEKNLETLFRIYDVFQEKNVKVNFLIVGDGTARKACEDHMKKAVFTGTISHYELAILYASADVFLFPSVSEAYGNVVLEAMASGLPCVIADGGGSQDFIEQGVNGFKCEPENENDYFEKIQLVLNHHHLRKQFIEEGLTYSSGFSWDKLAETYFDDINAMSVKNMLTVV
ncbi:glycosyltransferase family 1 protein [Mucilaginibacter sp. SD-g]|uniref:Glycosyltransferase family 1 protein n=2 Tax=Mucilaginibacter segetis TaxID=2793071 RepID=A0A934PUP2_9SPHI|nr:glycosyltransferase family 1 protein [Mucilaginibacter segetis]